MHNTRFCFWQEIERRASQKPPILGLAVIGQAGGLVLDGDRGLMAGRARAPW
jgi:hypothetical protein